MRSRFAFVLLIILTLTAFSVFPGEPEPFRFGLQPDPLTLTAEKNSALILESEVEKGYYLYRDMLSIKPVPQTGIHFETPIYPQPHSKYDPNTETEKQVYDGRNRFTLPLRLEATAPPAGTIQVQVSYQGCSSTLCYLPSTKTLSIAYRLAAPAIPAQRTSGPQAPAAPANNRAPAAAPPPGSVAANSSVPLPASPQISEQILAPPAPEEASPARQAEPVKNYASLWAFLALFGAGVITSFTPCVYPVIPITISVFGARGAESKTRAFLLSLAYVQGIGLVYSLLGVAAALTGAVFGQYMSNPWVVGVLAAIFVLLGLYMAGVFHFNVPSSLQTRAAGVGGKGFLGAFSMGMVSGVIAAPCTGPALAGVLLWISTTRDVVMGFFLLYTYAMGIGLLFIVLGTFSSLISKIPKSGGWMDIVKSVFAVLMFTVALFLIANNVAPLRLESVDRVTLAWLGALTILTGFLLRSLGIDFHGAGLADIGRKVLALILLTAGAHGLVMAITRVAPPPVTAAGRSGLEWRSDLNSALGQAAREGKPVLVDFYADWCAACKELDKLTYSDPAVQAELRRFVAVKIDMTRPTADSERFTKIYGIVGLPVVAFHDRAGRLLPQPRITGFVPPADFLKIVREIR